MRKVTANYPKNKYQFHGKSYPDYLCAGNPGNSNGVIYLLLSNKTIASDNYLRNYDMPFIIGKKPG